MGMLQEIADLQAENGRMRTKLVEVELSLHASRHALRLEQSRAEEAERRLATIKRDTLERAAKVCKERADGYKYETDPWAHEHIAEARHCEAAIRALMKEG